MPDHKDFNTHFNEWYYERKKRNNGTFDSSGKRRMSDSAHSPVGRWIDEAVGAVGEIVDVFRTRASLSGYDRQRLEAHKKLVRTIERTEKKMESRQKAIVVFGILAVASIFLFWEMEPVMLFSGLAGYMAYSTHQTRKKLNRLTEEYHRLEQGDFPMAVGYTIERAVMQHAYSHEGKVYPELLALEADFSLSQAEQILTACVQKRLASIELDEDGRTYYYFARLDNPHL